MRNINIWSSKEFKRSKITKGGLCSAYVKTEHFAWCPQKVLIRTEVNKQNFWESFFNITRVRRIVGATSKLDYTSEHLPPISFDGQKRQYLYNDLKILKHRDDIQFVDNLLLNEECHVLQARPKFKKIIKSPMRNANFPFKMKINPSGSFYKAAPVAPSNVINIKLATSFYSDIPVTTEINNIFIVTDVKFKHKDKIFIFDILSEDRTWKNVIYMDTGGVSINESGYLHKLTTK